MGFFLTPRHWHTAARAPPEVSSVMFRDFLIYGPVKVALSIGNGVENRCSKAGLVVTEQCSARSISGV
jgi:hypothetical protein